MQKARNLERATWKFRPPGLLRQVLMKFSHRALADRSHSSDCSKCTGGNKKPEQAPGRRKRLSMPRRPRRRFVPTSGIVRGVTEGESPASRGFPSLRAGR